MWTVPALTLSDIIWHWSFWIIFLIVLVNYLSVMIICLLPDYLFTKMYITNSKCLCSKHVHLLWHWQCYSCNMCDWNLLILRIRIKKCLCIFSIARSYHHLLILLYSCNCMHDHKWYLCVKVDKSIYIIFDWFRHIPWHMYGYLYLSSKKKPINAKEFCLKQIKISGYIILRMITLIW